MIEPYGSTLVIADRDVPAPDGGIAMLRASRRIARRSLLLLSLAALLPILPSCGSGGGGGGGNGILGDLNTDLVISQDTRASEIHAKNLTINDVATVSSTGDLKIQTAAKVTLNG